MKIKICGLFRREDIVFVNEALPDFIGFVFARSRRQVTPEKAAELKKLLAPEIKAVGVFVDSTPDFIANLVRENIIDIVQLHGSEDEAFVSVLRSLLPQETPIIRAFSVAKSEDIAVAEKFPCDFMLLDNGKGGTGQAFAWELLHDHMPDNVFLAGGVNTENIAEAIKINPFCIDVSSGAETDGVKDKNKILELVGKAHRQN